MTLNIASLECPLELKNQLTDKINYKGSIGWTCKKCSEKNSPFVGQCGCSKYYKKRV